MSKRGRIIAVVYDEPAVPVNWDKIVKPIRRGKKGYWLAGPVK